MVPIVQRLRRTGGALLAIVTIILVAEIAVMGILVLGGLAVCELSVVLLNGLALALVTAGPIYWLMVLPVHREHDKRVAAESRARELDRLAMTDPLTRVLNRRGIFARLLEAIAHAERYDRRLSVAMVDLDRFKEVNDRHGHAFGDEVLQRVVEQLVAALRASDLIGRLGGDEFLVVLPETPLALAAEWGERVRSRFERADFAIDGEAIHLAVSIGACELIHTERLGDLLARVDKTLYRAKEAGRADGVGAVCSTPGVVPGHRPVLVP